MTTHYITRPAAGSGMAADRVMTVVGLPWNPDGSGYHRFYLPFKHLTANSRHVFGIPAPGVKIPQPVPADLEDVDVLAMQRPAFANGVKQFRRLAGHVARVYETDDDLLSSPTYMLPEIATDPRAADTIRWCLAEAEMVTVSTPYLAEIYAQYNPNIRVLPNFINADLLDVTRPRRGRVTLGWQGGDSHLVDICHIQDALIEVLGANPQADMHWIGRDFSPVARRECRFTPWHADVWDYYRSVDFDVAIAPLAPIAWNRAKSHLKALDAAALGIPVVASDIEPYRDFVIDGVTGYLVRTHEQWVSRLTELLNDEAARKEMGAKARELASQWTIQDHWQLFEAAYEEAAR